MTGSLFDGVVADAAGACATGSRWTGGEQQMVTVRFDALGALAWERVQTGATRGTAVCRSAGGFCSAGGTAAASAGLVSPAGASSGSGRGAGRLRRLPPAAVAAGGTEYLYAAGAAAHDGGSAAMLIRYRP